MVHRMTPPVRPAAILRNQRLSECPTLDVDKHLLTFDRGDLKLSCHPVGPVFLNVPS